ncbi:restriction endonuclease subunit S [Sinorhizobium meliloti]|uniref:restriction endonuclease subunit S n=1 Tax=Rhizobium meliloti TaxID=382 RepID=UPI000FDC8400|nr:restriction endonuclease subunit S [Sinorhizobium meliloti]RVH97637.1 restriction endonuclease subunit S [Sinorhizobium meliloti]RVK82284.1 restriction endonuclease subunit S [Sinorhizobium meliloti]RVL18209.1 restriction endonuclease subunit S [Sinorhizobium meliloti]RVP39461.1 restriction endonuclease subunit S [Sinorhizobium meliloti]
MSVEAPKGWTAARFRDAMRLEQRREPIDPTRSYKLLGVRWYGNGAFLREERIGEGLSAQHIYRVQPGDVIYNRLFAWKGSFGLVGDDLAGCYVSNEFPLFAARLDRVDPQFLLRVLQHPRTSERADAFSTGTTSISRNRLSEEDFLHFPIDLPPLAEQRAIAEVLGAVEEAIATSEALIATIVDTKHATMRELLTRGLRRERAPMKPLPARWVLGRVAEAITHIPADWNLVALTKVAKLESGHTPSRDKADYWGGEIPWLSLADTDALDLLEVDQTSQCVTPKGIDNSSARILPKDTVVFSRTATVGKSSRMKRPMATSQDFANWVCGPTLSPAYLVQVFRHMKREWDRLQEGSTHQTIYMPVFKKLQILLPSIAEQQKIADVGEAFDIRIAKERETHKTLTQNRDALAQELLSGRVRLPDSIIARHRDKAGQAA